MSDAVTAKGSESKYKPHPDGQFVGQCVDVIDLGEKVQDFPGTTPYLAQTCALVFRTGEKNEETGEYIDVSKEYTVSMGAKANLRKDLEQWRGKAYTPEQVTEGVPLDKLTGNYGLLTVAHRKSGKGRIYANITACVGVPKQMASTVPTFTDYKRDDWWAKKKEEYAKAAAEFRGATSDDRGGEWEDFPGDAGDDDDDDLPF